MILAGDVGGTHCRLVACDESGNLISQRVYSSRAYARLADILTDFIAQLEQKPTIGCFGLPGPVLKGCCRVTNLDWKIDAAELAAQTGIGRVYLLNDLAANAYGITTLKPAEVLTVHAGEPIPEGNIAVLAPGTGLGEAGLIHADGQPFAIATEGGHTDFAPTTELEIELLRYGQRRFKAVTYETLVSGPGLEHIYDFLCERAGQTATNPLLEQLQPGDRSAAISQAALLHRDALCEQALDLFVEILASEAANLALKFLAVGGIYLGGGIPPKIQQKFFEPGFLRRFTAKDRMEWLLPRIPVYIILNDRAALQGATAHALQKLHAEKPR
jgi:glucokinase